MRMTPTERKLFRQKIIREYKLKHEKPQKKPNQYKQFTKLLQKLIPLNITIGVIASILYIYFSGWITFLKLLLSGIIWVTVISMLISTFMKNK